MAALWADYSAGNPGAAALRSAGFSGAVRYIALGSGSKLITKQEYDDLVSGGIEVHFVAEYGTTDGLGGYNAGVANARLALAAANALGAPSSSVIFAAADGHLNSAQVAVTTAYVQGFRDVLGYNRTGIYGFSEVIGPCHAAGLAKFFWQCGSSPFSTGTSDYVNLWQRNGSTGSAPTTFAGGIQCDINELLIPLNGVFDNKKQQKFQVIH